MAVQTLTILFTDIVGSTELLTSLDKREAERLRHAHFDILREQIEKRGGDEIKNLGDGLMAAFASAGDGIECAVAMQRAMARGDRGQQPLAIRIGLASGDVHLESGDCFGTAVVEASRLCARAEGGQVLLAESTRLLARGYEPIGDAGELELKGLPERTKAWVAEWSPDTPPTLRVVLADDAVLLREGIARVLEDANIEVVGQAGDPQGLLRLVAELRPDVAIVDVRMPPTHTTEGLDAAKTLREAYRGIGVLVLSQEVEPGYAGKLLEASHTGVGYLLKERVADVREFADAVRRVADGGTAFEPAVISTLLGEEKKNGGIRALTEEEVQALVSS
jgi:class 3 adenylate cyclase/DNA-binding NarL/FixJ family response regulator